MNYVVGAEAEDSDAQGVERLIAQAVVRLLVGVVRAVYLDCESCLFAIEVKDEVADRVLAAELHA